MSTLSYESLVLKKSFKVLVKSVNSGRTFELLFKVQFSKCPTKFDLKISRAMSPATMSLTNGQGRE